MSYQDRISQLLSSIESRQQATNKYTVLIILQHSVESAVEPRIPALRESNSFIVGFIALGSIQYLDYVIANAKGIVDTIAIDVDIKRSNSALIRATAVRCAKDNGIHYTFYSDYSSWISSAIAFMFEVEALVDKKDFYGKKRLLTGKNTLATRMILEMIERGMDVFLLQRDYPKLILPVAGGEIEIQSKYVHIVEAISDVSFDVLIGCELETQCQYIDFLNSIKFDYIYDIGTCNFSREFLLRQRDNGAYIYRSDDRAGISGVITSLMETKTLVSSRMGRTKICDIEIVSGGIIGEDGAIVVDDFSDPHFVFGVAAGNGTFKTSLTQEEQSKIDRLTRIL